MNLAEFLDKKLNEDDNTFKPPAAVANAAKRALDAKEKHGDKVKGGTRVGWTRANQLAKRENLTYDTIKRMHSFFARHDGNQAIDDPDDKDFKWADSGYTAWMIWGGDPGKRWADSIVKRMENKED